MSDLTSINAIINPHKERQSITQDKARYRFHSTKKRQPKQHE